MIKKWWHTSVIYQIYPKSFKAGRPDTSIGDLKGVIQKLDYIKRLGADVIWLCPVYQSPQIDNGYDISDYYSISPEYGTMEDFEQLIESCKNRGIRLIMDLVVNHTSDQHHWFQQALQAKDNPFRDYYIWRDPVKGGVPNELQSNFGGAAWKWHAETDQYYLHFYSDAQPDLNWSNRKLRHDIYDMMNFWIDKGVSGFRMDVIDLIGKDPDHQIKENGPMLHPYLQEMYEHTFGRHDLLTVGETWGATPENAPLYSDPERQELSMVFQFEHLQLDKVPGKQRWDLQPLVLTELKCVLNTWQTALHSTGWNSLFWNNHDLPRIVSRWGNDQKFRVESAKMLATLLHGMQGTPYIYQGEEIGMTNAAYASLADYKDIETQNIYRERIKKGFSHEQTMTAIRLKARDNARTPMQWSRDRYAGFSDAPPWMKLNENYKEINVEQALHDPDSIFYHYQTLIALRKKHEVLVYGSFRLILEQHEQVFAYERHFQGKTLVVVCNFYDQPVSIILPGAENRIILSSNYKDSSLEVEEVYLRPYEAIIYLEKRGESGDEE
ncbi:glycoside hydrolase family 13 protein [Exiguobacterium undae]|uniref:glycoside hydrolase family 13 protein n=1 Tax=Exiguobacterium undae TaxID=169177 RepID=UPI000479B211|nr:alpha-glucosidase [Exiguobacterium undae]